MRTSLETARKCKKCGLWLPAGRFEACARWRRQVCNTCRFHQKARLPSLKARHGRWAAAHPEKMKQYCKKYYHQTLDSAGRFERSLKRYQLTVEDYARMFEGQNRRCANLGCRVDLDMNAKFGAPSMPVVDHCHSTGRVRAILCFRCNLLEGHVVSPAQALGIIEYMAKHKAVL